MKVLGISVTQDIEEPTQEKGEWNKTMWIQWLQMPVEE
jgi:hypothetical protein